MPVRTPSLSCPHPSLSASGAYNPRMTQPPAPETSPARLCTAVNCSVGRPAGDPDLDRAGALGLDRIELWWPWTTPEPSDDRVDDLLAELSRRRLTLVALNFWGGDTSVGDRGVLHRHALTQRHLDIHARVAEATGADRFNLLVGRGGRRTTAAQLDRVAAVADSVASRIPGTVLIEPSRSPGPGPADYPVQTPEDADRVIRAVSGTGLLMDFWHVPELADAWLRDLAESGTVPAHVQLADDPGRGSPGSGVLPLGRWVSALRAAGYTGDIAGEWVW